MEYADEIRVSDAERERVVNDLTRHLTAGRLDIHEFDVRVGEVYRATTRGGLQRVLSDLPTAPSVAPTPRPTGHRLPVHVRVEWLTWLTACIINLVTWGIISIATGTMPYFWPMWVIGPWGLVLLGRTVLGRTVLGRTVLGRTGPGRPGCGVSLAGNRFHGPACGARQRC